MGQAPQSNQHRCADVGLDQPPFILVSSAFHLGRPRCSRAALQSPPLRDHLCSALETRPCAPTSATARHPGISVCVGGSASILGSRPAQGPREVRLGGARCPLSPVLLGAQSRALWNARPGCGDSRRPLPPSFPVKVLLGSGVPCVSVGLPLRLGWPPGWCLPSEDHCKCPHKGTHPSSSPASSWSAPWKLEQQCLQN